MGRRKAWGEPGTPESRLGAELRLRRKYKQTLLGLKKTILKELEGLQDVRDIELTVFEDSEEYGDVYALRTYDGDGKEELVDYGMSAFNADRNRAANPVQYAAWTLSRMDMDILFESLREAQTLDDITEHWPFMRLRFPARAESDAFALTCSGIEWGDEDRIEGAWGIETFFSPDSEHVAPEDLAALQAYRAAGQASVSMKGSVYGTDEPIYGLGHDIHVDWLLKPVLKGEDAPYFVPPHLARRAGELLGLGERWWGEAGAGATVKIDLAANKVSATIAPKRLIERRLAHWEFDFAVRENDLKKPRMEEIKAAKRRRKARPAMGA